MLESRRRRVTAARSLALVIPLALGLHSTACGPSDPLEKARVLQDEKNDLRGSLELLRDLVESRPDDPEVHYRYGRALLATGDAGLAVWPLRKAVESPEWLERAGLALAGALNAQGAYDESIAICTRILEKNPDHVPTLLARAGTRMLSRRGYEELLADVDRVLELEPDNQDALGPRVVALLGLNRVEEAGKALEEYEAHYRDDTLALHGSPALCIARATFAKEKGEKELAEEGYGACLERFPTDSLVLRETIEYYDGSGRPERAEAVLRRAVELAPENTGFRLPLALRLAAAGRVDEGETILRQGIEVASREDAAEAWAVVASYNVDHGDLDDAIEAFGRVQKLGDITADPQLLLAYADALVIAKRFDEAEKLVEQMKVPAHQSVVRGRIELEKGNPAGALKLFDEGMRIWPNSAEARYYAAIAAEELGDFGRAIEEYRYAMRIDVTATDAYLRQARIQSAAGHDEAALSTLAFQPGGRPEEVAASLFEVRIRTRLGHEEVPPWVRETLSAPEHRGAAVAAMGEGVRERGGPKASLAAMKAAKLDLGDPMYAEALAAIVEDQGATRKAKEGLALVDVGLRKHPDSAAFLAIRGRALQLSGAPTAEVRAAFDRALAVDAKNGIALAGLARVESEAGSKEAALALYDRAVAADPNDRTSAREAAALLVALGRAGEAEERLTALLRDHPYDATAARTLAELRLARGAQDARTVELAKRAVAFRGGPEAKALLDRIAPQGEAASPTASAQDPGVNTKAEDASANAKAEAPSPSAKAVP